MKKTWPTTSTNLCVAWQNNQRKKSLHGSSVILKMGENMLVNELNRMKFLNMRVKTGIIPAPVKRVLYSYKRLKSLVLKLDLQPVNKLYRTVCIFKISLTHQIHFTLCPMVVYPDSYWIYCCKICQTFLVINQWISITWDPVIYFMATNRTKFPLAPLAFKTTLTDTFLWASVVHFEIMLT